MDAVPVLFVGDSAEFLLPTASSAHVSMTFDNAQIRGHAVVLGRLFFFICVASGRVNFYAIRWGCTGLCVGIQLKANSTNKRCYCCMNFVDAFRTRYSSEPVLEQKTRSTGTSYANMPVQR